MPFSCRTYSLMLKHQKCRTPGGAMRSHSVLVGRTLLISAIATNLLALPLGALAQASSAQAHTESDIEVHWEVIAQIREEGLQRSQIANTLSYMADVLGARLTNSIAMDNAQRWVAEEMKRIGLEKVYREPFMEYGVSWDNEYVSIHLLKPDYQPMVGYPIAHTPGTDGKQELQAIIADVRTHVSRRVHPDEVPRKCANLRRP